VIGVSGTYPYRRYMLLMYIICYDTDGSAKPRHHRIERTTPTNIRFRNKELPAVTQEPVNPPPTRFASNVQVSQHYQVVSLIVGTTLIRYDNTVHQHSCLTCGKKRRGVGLLRFPKEWGHLFQPNDCHKPPNICRYGDRQR
jgi:hypothetical protein